VRGWLGKAAVGKVSLNDETSSFNLLQLVRWMLARLPAGRPL